MAEINLDVVVLFVRAFGVEATVEQTGGGTATIYAGGIRQEEGYGDRYAAVAGPGWFEGPGWTQGRASTEDFYVGPDDYGDVTPVICQEVGADDEVKVARLIVAQAVQNDPTQVVRQDIVASLLQTNLEVGG